MKKASYIFLLVLFLLAAVRPEAQAQKRISPQAKGTIIGAGAGALGGALIHKRNRAAGGVVGGVVGAGAGYAVGKHIDNKQKERARIAAANRAAAQRAAAARATAARKASATNGVAAAPAAMALTSASTQPAASTVLANGYLVNSTYGERDTPYPTSEYRRKSW
ncbi:glycine zipper 2TM domain-containing protein [Hymenobacter sp. BT507]|uniref:Glycine zipper 2TM domain-containing protein n=1 Tax=Hymenobacter citatus TaxID=2763506 RepID=A0ABR7MNT4_9BACT|nr:glycine zipper domain-containing protein [Hymenobacter citatus]MBC6612755.1 glycine zipper 2TM domain-containing protein [Hymenobacter citatus]